MKEIIESLYRSESRKVLATLIRLLGDFAVAEDALHEAFRAAMEKWPVEGVPGNPTAWLISAGRFKAIDNLRKIARLDTPLEWVEEIAQAETSDLSELSDEQIEDDQLRLIFTCCHPALGEEARVALTLREICRLTTEEIARAFVATSSTLAQRIVRAKSKIKEARIPYEVPARSELLGRLDTVLQVIYLIFNEGYSASSGSSLTRADMSLEAIRLGRLLVELLPESEAVGLLALMLLHDSRRAARSSPTGELILLDDQDRSLWNREQIEEGRALVNQALTSGRIGPYSIQAAISAEHARAQRPDDINWAMIVGLYDLLMQVAPSPVVKLNRAVAVARRDTPEAGLKLIDAVLESGELDGYHLLHSARADLCRRLGKTEEARISYQTALELARLEPERRFLERRLTELSK
jgi:RNA polymerase sigma-70 factor (ECF subfamily)